MQRTLVTLGIGLTFAIGSALAQQPTMTEKAKDAAHTIGEKTKEAVEKVKDMAQDAAPAGAANAKIERMQKQADADFKSAKAKCDPIEPRLKKTVCEKQAAVDHATAELRIAKANAAAQGDKTSTMGAGKAAR